MKILELFSGTGHISDKFRAHNHKAWKVDWSKDLDANLHTDISKLTANDIIKLCGGKPDVIWASPDCATYSIAATQKGGGMKHREFGTYAPKTGYAKICDETDQHVFNLIAELKPKYWFVENPRGMFRKVHGDALEKIGGKRYTIAYCQYGSKNMKPTDIWTNHPNPEFKPMCKNGDPCHERNYRYATTKKLGLERSSWQRQGVDGMYNRAITRAVVPDALIEHIVNICESEEQ